MNDDIYKRKKRTMINGHGGLFYPIMKDEHLVQTNQLKYLPVRKHCGGNLMLLRYQKLKEIENMREKCYFSTF